MIGWMSMMLLCAQMASGATFEEQRKAISSSAATRPESAIKALLEAGIKEAKPAPAMAEANKWLRHNRPKDPQILYLAGRVAELSGDWDGAVALYRQFLDEANVKSAEASDAITATYALKIQYLADDSSAYTFGRTQADHLAANPRFRQYDRWFLNQARSRNDREGAAIRLLATAKAGVSNDQMLALYDGDLHWLLSSIRATRYDQKQDWFSDDFVKVVQELASAINYDPELKLALDWAVSVKAYNQAILDGKEAAAPLGKAGKLIKTFPHYALRVQNDWAGGHNGQHYRGDAKKYWADNADKKKAPIRAALEKLNSLQQAELIESWNHHYYHRNPEMFTVEEMREFVTANPEMVNRKAGSGFSLGYEKLIVEEAEKLAPQLDQSPSPEAAFVRALAAAGKEKDFDKAMDALLGPEVWRLGPGELDGGYADRLWHSTGRPGGNTKRDQAIARSKEVVKKIPSVGALKKMPAGQRLKRFQELWMDYRSKQPKTPAVRFQIQSLIQVTPDAVKELIRDSSPEAQYFVRNALRQGLKGDKGNLTGDASVTGLNPHRYDPVFTRLMGRHRQSVDELKKKDLYQPHPLLADLQKKVAADLKGNQLQSWMVLAWINAQFPENDAGSVALMEQILTSPQWTQLSYEARFAARSWFKEKAMTKEQFAHVQASDPDLICRDLLSLSKDADAATAASALEKTLKALMDAPVRVEIKGLEQLAELKEEVGKDPKVIAQLVELADSFRSFAVNNTVGTRLLSAVRESEDPSLLLRSAAYLWREVQVYHRNHNALMDLADALADAQPAVSSTLARCGLQTFERHRHGHTWFKRDTDIPRLKAVRGKAAMQLGLVVIPVPPNHPAYSIYRSQAEWMTGNEDAAGNMLDKHWDQLMGVYKELSVPYLLWSLQRAIYSREEERQEELAKALLSWAEEKGSAFSLQEEIRLEIAYGDIAMQRGQLRQAHEIYSRTRKNEAYKEVTEVHAATLRKAAAERIAKNFDGALKTLNELEMERIPEIWAATRYARAEVYFDMEEYDDAADDIASILAREPDHADATILQGKIQLQRQQLMEATEVELGAATSQESLVPGEKLKVTLVDPTLAVSGAGTEIEVVVWATSGDKEQFFLRRFGDQKTKFRGEVATSLGAPQPNDGILQVIGDDEIYYAYSERFRVRMNNLPEKRGGPIRIASDALLMASARKLLSEAEQRVADLERVMQQIGRGQRTADEDLEAMARKAIAARNLDASARVEDGGALEEDFSDFLVAVAKPGNPVHVRVIDPDRSRTAEIDELTVSVSSSSGDSIAQVTLKETGTHTGWFEGSISTTGAQAMAMAPNSEPGRDPNMVISPKADYPAWRPIPEDGVVPEFIVDLNDSVALGQMTIKAAESGAKWEKFQVQTAMRRGDWTTVAVYPKNQVAIAKPWYPSVVIMNDADKFHNNNNRSVYDFDEIRQHVEHGWITQAYGAGVAENVSGPSQAMDPSIPAKVKWLRQNRHHNSHVIYRFRGYFHEPKEVIRHFKVELGNYQPPEKLHPSVAHPSQFLLAVNGRPITSKEKSDKLEGKIKLKPGIHHFEIWATGWDGTIGFGRSVKLLANLKAPDSLVDCPDSFFDPDTFPVNRLEQRNAPAAITGSGDGTEFKVEFAENSRSRLLRFVLLDYEGTAPALNKVTLSEPGGKQVLPVPVDFATLERNDTLEILADDQISVRYVDDRFVTKSKQRLERFLDVRFTNARVEFADMKPRWNEGHGKLMPFYEPLLRFPYDQPLALAIHDADMDVSVQPDTVSVKIAAGKGEGKVLEARETGDSTGVFKLMLTPVSPGAKPGNAQNPITVPAGEMVVATYRDEETTQPGVATDRVGAIAHANFQTPGLSVAHVTRVEFQEPRSEESAGRPLWQVECKLIPSTQPPEGGLELLHGRIASLEIDASHLALRPSSTVTVFAQTDAGRKAAEVSSGPGIFNINVPGTIGVEASLKPAHGYTASLDWIRRGAPLAKYYHGGWVFGQPDLDNTSRFRVTFPLIPGLLPDHGYLSYEERREHQKAAQTSRFSDLMDWSVTGLVAKPGEKVHIGIRYQDPSGQEKWLTTQAKVITRPVFEVLDKEMMQPLTSVYAGETLYLRVSDLGADVSDGSDAVTVLMQAKSGAKRHVELRETEAHSGIFTGAYSLSYADKPGELPEDYDVKLDGFPIVYGDTLAIRYTDPNGIKSPIRSISVSKGADGRIAPFSKKYEDQEIAMRTQFSLSEAYLEMAKRHRELGEENLAEQEYRSAKLLLTAAMDQFIDPETRAHAEYLLGNVSLEEAVATEEGETRENRFRAALSRFMNVTGTYPDTLHASKAQFKIATIYEALKEPDIAAQEYVKLAYKYPDSEFLATAMARLGTHLLKKAAGYEAQAKPLLAKGEEGDKDAAFEGEALQKMSQQEYYKTAKIFGRLQERFPDHELAGKAGFRSGQAYMRAQDNRQALKAFLSVVNKESYDKEVRSQAMYWAGKCYQNLREQMAAYSIFKRLTYDFPETEWAAYARGELSQPGLLDLERKLEIKRLEATGEQ